MVWVRLLHGHIAGEELLSLRKAGFLCFSTANYLPAANLTVTIGNHTLVGVLEKTRLSENQKRVISVVTVHRQVNLTDAGVHKGR